MPFDDLREFISALQARHEIKLIEGAGAELEIGAVTQIAAESAPCPALLFDSITGFRKGQRMLTNATANRSRERLVCGLSADLSDKDALSAWKDKLKRYQPIAAAYATQAPVKQNVLGAGQIDLSTLPWPRWYDDDPVACQHGALVATRDPRSGEIGLSSRSFTCIDRDTIGARVAPDEIDPFWREFWASGKPCPVTISLGQDPALLASVLGGMSAARAAGFDFAGWFRGAPVKVTEGEYTGLPIPASAEMVLEGEINPPHQKTDGPDQGQPMVKIHRLYFRNDPIILAAAPFLASSHGVLASLAAALWIELEERGIAGICGVNHRPWGVTVVSLKQIDAGHVKRVARALMESSVSRDLRYAIVVDDDIDPFNLEKVFWAIATRYEPQVALDIVRRVDKADGDFTYTREGSESSLRPGSAAIIDACRPYRWIDKFPRTTDISEELMKRTVQKWGKVLERKV